MIKVRRENLNKVGERVFIFVKKYNNYVLT